MSDQTICAISTPPGIGGIAVIRVSGAKALEITDSIFSRSLLEAESHKALHGWIVDGNERVDEVVVTLFRAPRSFTGEDTTEIACHGSGYIQQRILELLLQSGASMAGHGEFTMRAYLNGRMDLSQAEAVGDLIAAESAAAHKQALHQMRGGFSKEINALRDKLIHFASMVELELDFAEEDVEFANRGQLSQLIGEIRLVVEHLRQSFKLGNAIKNGVPVAIVGAPNMGKSTLLNALLNEERAIVSDIAGTTRDTVEDSMVLGGIRFKFIDTAGIRETTDTIEKMGIERSLAKVQEASIVLVLFDAAYTHTHEVIDFIEDVRGAMRGDARMLLVGNKIDKTERTLGTIVEDLGIDHELVLISAKQGQGVDALKEKLQHYVNVGQVQSGETIVTNIRHFEALTLASQSLQDVMTGLDNRVTGDFLAIDIRKTLYHLGDITGQINADDLLNSIFSKFCIGK
ncbi:MAG: tRNA uridine-5-carboxymethylaminomethyl(34) synthesis GTPase MnmE [Flavobacteriales bacterium]